MVLEVNVLLVLLGHDIHFELFPGIKGFLPQFENVLNFAIKKYHSIVKGLQESRNNHRGKLCFDRDIGNDSQDAETRTDVVLLMDLVAGVLARKVILDTINKVRN